jgi:hypothetical protein
MKLIQQGDGGMESVRSELDGFIEKIKNPIVPKVEDAVDPRRQG